MARSVTTEFSRGTPYVAIALLAFVVGSWLLHAVLPPAIPKGVEAKLKFFTEHKDEFDTVFLGTSHFYYAISPDIFDETTRANGLQTRTFNFGIDAMHPPENFYVLEQILKTRPRNLKWVVVEMGEIQVKWTDEELSTQRLLYWHDWPRTALTLRKALDPRGDAKWYGKIARLWLRRRELTANLLLFAKQFANAGRATDFFLSRNRDDSAQSKLELGPKQDGYRLAGAAMSAELAAGFQQRLAQELSGSRSKILDPSTDQAYRHAAEQIRHAGANPIFIVTPILWQSPLRFRQSPPPGPLLSFNDAKAHPSLYKSGVRVDDSHLTKEGSDEFTRLIARELLRQSRLP